MTQLALLLALALIGLAASFVLGRLEVERGPVSATVKRLEGALERASLTVLRVAALRGVLLLLVPAVGLGVFSLTAPATGPISPLGQAIFCGLSLVAGAASALLPARFSLALAARAASCGAAAAARGSARALRPLLRAAVATAIFSEGLGLLGVAAAFACPYAVLGGFAAAGGSSELVRAVVELLPPFALGAAVMSLALSREGSVAAAAASVGGNQAAEREAALDAGDPRAPALLAELVGQQVGELLPRALSAYVCGVAATVSAALLAVSGQLSAAGALSALVLFLVVRLFGGVGAICGILAARATDEESAALALLRGQVSAVVVALFGLGAALFWLERASFGRLFLTGALGLSATLVVAQLACLPLRRGTATSRELMDARSTGDSAAIVRAAGSAFSRLWPALLVPALALALGEHFAGPPGGLLLLTFVAGVLSLGPLSLAIAGFGLLVEHTRGVAAIARLESERTSRTRLEDASALGRAIGATHASLVLAASLSLGLWALFGGGTLSLSGSLGAAGLVSVSGVSLVLLFAARASGSALRGARLVASEVERQFREYPRQQGVVQLPADFTPSYRPCLEATVSAARGASVIEAALVLLTPFVLGALLKLSGQPSLTQPLIGFALATVLSGVVYALAARGTRALLGELERRLRGDAHSSTSSFSTYGELVGVTGATSVEALVCALTLTVFCLATLLG